MMTKIAIVGLWLSVLVGCASMVLPKPKAETTALKAGQYALDRSHAALVFKIDHLGFSQFIGRFERFDARLDFEAGNPEAASVEAVIDVTSLDVANDDFAKTLMNESWFDAKAYPEARFRSTGIEKTSETKGRMTGELTLKGVTKPVTLDVVFNGGDRDLLRGAYVVGFSAKGSFDRGDFGVDKYGGVVGDRVDIEIEAEFGRR